jgi:hypothetical protein
MGRPEMPPSLVSNASRAPDLLGRTSSDLFCVPRAFRLESPVYPDGKLQHPVAVLRSKEENPVVTYHINFNER